MKLAYIFSSFLLVFSFKLYANQPPAAPTADELPIVEFETKKQIQLEDESMKKKKKQQGSQLVVSDQAGSDMNMAVVIAKKSKAKTTEKVEEEDFSRLDRELEVLK